MSLGPVTGVCALAGPTRIARPPGPLIVTSGIAPAPWMTASHWSSPAGTLTCWGPDSGALGVGGGALPPPSSTSFSALWQPTRYGSGPEVHGQITPAETFAGPSPIEPHAPKPTDE